MNGVCRRREHLGPHTVGSVLAVVSLVFGDVPVVYGLLVVDTLRPDDLGHSAAFDDSTICGIEGCFAGKYIKENLGRGGPSLATTMLVDLHHRRRLRYVPIALPHVIELVGPSARSAPYLKGQIGDAVSADVALDVPRGNCHAISLAIDTTPEHIVGRGICGVLGLGVEADVFVVWRFGDHVFCQCQGDWRTLAFLGIRLASGGGHDGYWKEERGNRGEEHFGDR